MTDTKPDTSAEAIDVLRLQAFRTNSPEDREAYFNAASTWFQNRHIRAMERDDALRADLATARNAALEEAAARIGPKGEEPCTDPSNHGDTIELAAWHEANACANSILSLKTSGDET